MSTREIQRRILEAVELNSLKCLDIFCQLYEKNPISTESDVELFHRRYGLSFWPLDERPKETAIHLLASKITSTEAMKILENHPKFLHDFSDVPDSHGSTPLLLAIKCNNMEVVQRLLLTKPDVSKRNRHNESPIYVAALNDDAKAINRILETCKLLCCFIRYFMLVISINNCFTAVKCLEDDILKSSYLDFCMYEFETQMFVTISENRKHLPLVLYQ